MSSNWLRSRLQFHDAKYALSLLPLAKRRKLMLLAAIQLALGVTDLVAIGLVGALGSIAVAGIQSRPPEGLPSRLLGLLGAGQWSPQSQVAILGVMAALMLLTRTAASIWLTRKALHFLAVRAADASSELAARVLSQPLTYVHSHSSADFQYAVTVGVTSLIVGVLGTLVTILADVAMLAAIAVLLFSTSPLVSLLLLAMLVLMGAVLQRFTTNRAGELGRIGAEADIESRSKLIEALATYRDAMVRGSRPRYAAQIRTVREQSAWISAETAFLPNVSKYVLENGVILCALVVGAAQFAISGADAAVSTLAIFLAAGTRLAPAIIRIQQGTFSLRSSAGQAQPALALIHELEQVDTQHVTAAAFSLDHEGFSPAIEIDGVTFCYPGSDSPALKEWNVRLRAGEMLALVGPSGAGKSTAADILIGALTTDSGSVCISGLSPKEAVRRWPGAIAYVPQEVWIVEGSVRENVALGFDAAEVPDSAIWSALAVADLDDFVRSLPERLNSVVGERGARLSGGQRQRLGIARAVLTQPRLLVLDEATSALDAETEYAVTEAMRAMRGHVTFVVIAHRLATVRAADVVQYLDNSTVVAQGSFSEVRRAVPAFARQAALLGL